MRLLAVFVSIVLMYTNAQDMCEDGWIQFRDPARNTVCVLVVKTPQVWKAARNFCERRLGKLMMLDNFGQLSYFKFTEESDIFVGEEIVETYSIDEFWSGMYVDQGRLMWNDYGPKLVQRRKFANIQSWRWNDNQPDPVTGRCGKASVEQRQLNNGPVYNYRTAIATLSQCETELPFVCRKPPVRRQVKAESFCPENWVGNLYVPYCYRIYKELVSYDKAKEQCRLEGSELAPSGSQFDTEFASVVAGYYNRNDEFGNVRTIWLKDTNSTRQCSALDAFSSEVAIIRDVACNTTLLVMCVRPTQSVDSVSIQTISDYFNQETLEQYQPFQPLPVYGKIDRALQDNDVIFVRTPSFILNSTNRYQQWNFDNSPSWRVVTSIGNPYYANITLPFNQTPSKRRRRDVKGYYSGGTSIQKRQIPDDEFTFINYDNIRQTTGYYTFGIYNINPPKYQQETPQLVRYSEKDLYIFVAVCEFADLIIGPSKEEPYFSIENANSFNLLRDDSYIGPLQEMDLGAILLESPPLPGQRVAYYNAQIEAIINTTLKFRIFMAPTAARLQTIPLEPIAYEAVKEHFRSNLRSNFFKVQTLRVRSTVMCAFTQTRIDGKMVTFEATAIGETGYSWERCYPNNKALATATCRGGYDNGASFHDFKFADDCGTVPNYTVSTSSDTLKNLSETVITKDNVESVLNATANLTTPDVNLTEADIIYTADILYNYLKVGVVNTPDVMDTVFEIVDNVLRSGSDVIDTAQKITNAANRIILSLDDLTNNLALLNNKYAQFVQDLVASEIWEQSGNDDVTIGISLNKTDSKIIKKEALSSVREPVNVEVPGTDTAIYLTKSLLTGGKTKLTFQIYGNTDLFTVISSRFKVNSKVAAARLTRNNEPVVDLGDEYVTAVFYPYEERDNLVCAYWNYSANENAGGWNTEGCSLSSYESDRIVCKCNHLTNFAVLIDLKAGEISDTDKLVLDIITKVGLVISIIGLGITILTFLVFKHLRNGRGQQVLINLSVAMLCSSILFLVGVDRTESYGGCIAVSALLHYFILVTFMWMLVEGLLQYLRFVKVLGTYIPKFMIKSMIPAWGLPLIPVIVVLAIDYDMYYGGNGYCWLSWDPFLYAFIIPVAVIIFANIIVFFMVMCNLCCRRKHKGMVSNQSEKKMAFLHFQAGISILVILGLTWVFGFLTVDSTRIVFHYLFAIFNAFQGFFIFLLFTSREKQIRNAWRKLCCKKSQYKSTSSGTDSRPRKQSADNTNSTGLLSKGHGNNSVNSNNSNNSNGDEHFGNGDHHFNNPEYDKGI